ncbi:hypothetical protein FO519_001353 [Halicephalobus sp. NKZ332]|nr:hypothetical protein FO519_001353 [Halicephalobus sp. NKZ332]
MIVENRKYVSSIKADIAEFPEIASVEDLLESVNKTINNAPYLAACISNAITFMQKHPFPDVLNRVFTSLKDVFLKTDSNLVRYRIAVLAKECKTFIRAYQTPELMLKTMIQISHNRDPEARSCSLLLLAAMAPVMYSESHAHHLILEGLSSSNNDERSSAIYAAIEFAKLSITFCDIAIEKFDTMVSSAYVDDQTKIRILRAISSFRDSVSCCDRVDKLCRELLSGSSSKTIIVASYELLTSVAKKRAHVFEHVNFLLNELEANSSDPVLVSCLVTNLAKISNSSRWTVDQVERLLDSSQVFTSQRSPVALRQFFKCLSNIVSKPEFIPLLSKRALMLTLLMSHDDFETAVSAAAVAIKLGSFEQGTGSTVSSVVHLLPSLLNRMEDSTRKLQRSLLKLTVDYCNGLYTNNDQTLSIVTHLMNIISTSSSCYDLMLESLNAICSCSPQVYSLTIDFGWKVLNEKLEKLTQDVDMESNSDYVFTPLNLLISLVLAPQYVRTSTSPDLDEFVNKFAMKTSYRQQYDIAVLGFRYGHWKSVSLPLLENISCGRLSTTAHYWINSLIDIASAQMINFDSDLCPNTRRSSNFGFPYLFTNILSKITFTLRCFFTFIGGNLKYLEAGTDYAKYAIVTQCDLMLRDCEKIGPILDEIEKFSFDADPESRNHVILLQQFKALIEYSFWYLSATPYKPLPTNFVVMTESPMNAHLRDVIAWSRTQFAKMDQSIWQDRVNYSNVMLISDILKELYIASFYLPRAFFQLIHSTKIRLNIKVPLKKDNNDIYFASQLNKMLPVEVEGFVETNNPAGIQLVNVRAILTSEKGFSDGPPPAPVTHQRSVELNGEDNRFLARFGFSLPNHSKVNIKFSVTFTDRETKKTWQSNAAADIFIKVGRGD